MKTINISRTWLIHFSYRAFWFGVSHEPIMGVTFFGFGFVFLAYCPKCGRRP